MEFSSETVQLLALVEERVSGQKSFEAAFQLTLQSFLQVCPEKKKKKKEVNIIAKSAIQKLMEDLEVEEQYVQDIAMQMKRLGVIRDSKAKKFAEKTVDVGWIEKKPNGALFYVDAWGNDQKVPDKDTFLNKFFPAWVEEVGGVNLLNTKKDQGFTHLNLLCTGVELARLGELSESTIISAHEGQGLYFPGKTLITSTADRGTQITKALSGKKVCYFGTGYTAGNQDNQSGKGLVNADLQGNLLFYPKQFDPSAHGGVTFEEYVKKTGSFQCSLSLPEGNLKCTSDASAAQIGGRTRHETNKTPDAYLAETTFAGRQYAGESWMTLHELLVFRTSILIRYGILIDNDTATWVMGAYLKNKWSAPLVYWHKNYHQMIVIWNLPDSYYVTYGVRSSVKKV